MASKPILVEKQGHVCVFTLNRPQDMNAVNRDLSEAFEKALDAFEADDSVWVGVVKSSNRAAAPASVRAWADVSLQRTSKGVLRWRRSQVHQQGRVGADG